MTAESENNKKIEVKRKLAAKYAHLATLTKSTPKRRHFTYRSERLRRQADEMARR